MSRLRNWAPLALLAGPLAVAGCGSAGPDATTLLRLTKVAVSGAASVHYVDVTTIKGRSENQTITGSVSATKALVTLAVNTAPQLEVVLDGTTAYVTSSSASVLQNSMGLSASQAAAWTGKWISVTSTDAPYNTILSSISITSEVSAFYPTAAKATVQSVRTMRGMQVYPVTSNTTSKGAAEETTLFINVATSLPVGGTIVAKSTSSTEQKVAVFQNWNKPFTVTAPTGATPLATVLAS